MLERRRRREVPDTGARRRVSDAINAPQERREPVSTFHLRWARHIRHEPHAA